MNYWMTEDWVKLKAIIMHHANHLIQGTKKRSISIALIHIIRHILTKSGGIWYVSVVQFITHGEIPHMPCL